MDSVLVPKRLVFRSPSPGPPIASLNYSHEDDGDQLELLPVVPTPLPTVQPTQHRQQPRSSPSQPPPVRYGVPEEPDAYYSRFQYDAHARRYGVPLSDEGSSDEEEVEDEDGWQDPMAVQQDLVERSYRPSPPIIVELSPVEEVMQKLKLDWHAAAEVKSVERATRLADAFQAADKELTHELAAIKHQLDRKHQEILQADVRQAAQQLQARNQKIQELQRSHEKSAAQQQEQVAKLERAAAEEAARRKAEQDKRDAEAKAAEEAAAKKAQKAADKKAAEDKAKAAQEAAKAEQVKAASAPAATAATTAGATQPAAAAKASAAARCMRCAPQAVALEKQVAKKAEELHEGMKALISDEGLKKQRRDIEKKMTVHVQQISATLDQVARKCMDVYELITAQRTPEWRHYAMLMFANKVVKQWELVMLNNKAAFPLATVLVKVSTQFPELMDLTLSQLHRECCFTVPCAFTSRDEASGAELGPVQLRRLIGYKETDDPNRPGGKLLETDDEFVRRVEGMMFMYGAIIQVDEQNNPHGLEFGWRWLARFLNHIPASRAAGKALIFFLRAAGFALHNRFRGQFIKLLKCMHDEFLPELSKSGDADVQSVCTLLQHYLVHGQYKQEPEGHSMPRVDMSSFQRA